MLLLRFAVDGKYFFEHLNLPRLYYPADIVTRLSTYLYFMQAAFLAACMWLLRTREFGARRLLATAFAAAHVIATFLLGGAGAGINHLYEAMLATAIGALIIPEAEALVGTWRFPRVCLAVLLILPFFLTSLLVLPRRIPSDLARYAKEVPESEAEFKYVANFLKGTARPGDVRDAAALLRGRQARRVRFLRGGRIHSHRQDSDGGDSAVAGIAPLPHHPDRVVLQPAHAACRADPFPGPSMRLLFAKYKVAFRTKWYAVFIPNEG
ncbi:MAG: hypothetical protein ABI806_11055 [Candidatus Solibacter sp.]